MPKDFPYFQLQHASGGDIFSMSSVEGFPIQGLSQGRRHLEYVQLQKSSIVICRFLRCIVNQTFESQGYPAVESK